MGRGQDVPVHPKILSPCSCMASGHDPGFPSCAQERHSVTSLLQAELWLEHVPNSACAHTSQGRGRMGALRAEPAALGRCCARSRGRSAKGNANILPKESTFHRQHKFPFLHRAGLFQAAFPTTLPGSGQSRPSCPTETRHCPRVRHWRGLRLTWCETPQS